MRAFKDSGLLSSSSAQGADSTKTAAAFVYSEDPEHDTTIRIPKFQGWADGFHVIPAGPYSGSETQ